jgi:hypothetical protein
MDRVKIREYIINKLTELTEGRYTITGSFPSVEEIPNILLVVDISREVEVLGRNMGPISVDKCLDTETFLYVTSMLLSISIYTPLDEESTRIGSEINTLLRQHIRSVYDEECGLQRVYSIFPPSLPLMREQGNRKTWVVTIQIDVEIFEEIVSQNS